jgi:hypothetical protein
MSLNEDSLVAMNTKIIQKMMQYFLVIKYNDIVEEDDIYLFTFQSIIKNITAVSVNFNPKDFNHTLTDSQLVMYTYDPVVFTFNYVWEFTFNDVHIVSGTGTAILSTQFFELMQFYLSGAPDSTIDGAFLQPKVTVTGSIFTSLFNNSICNLIAYGMMDSLIPLIQKCFDLIGKQIDDEFTMKFSENDITMPDHSVTIFNSFVNGSTENVGGVQWQEFYLNSSTIVDEVGCQVSVTGITPYIEVLIDSSSERYCISNEVFTAVVSSEAGCGFRTNAVNLSEWNLYGNLGELFDILPSLADWYNSNTPYTIQRTILPNINFLPQLNNTIILAKQFDFIITTKNITVLSIIASFQISLYSYCDSDPCNFFNAKQTNVLLANITSIPQLDITGKGNARMLIMNELTSIGNNNNLLLAGVPVPSPVDTRDGLTRKIVQYSGSICAEYA